MKRSLLIEMPLPIEWDKTEFNANKSFKSRLKYAIDRAKKAGTGSSRIAVVIEFEGRKTILKFVKNKKGFAQNKAEADFLDDYYMEGLEIAIPLIDYDMQNDPPVWIHTEFAEKASERELCNIMKCDSLDDLVRMANYVGNVGPRTNRLDPGLSVGQLSEDDAETRREYIEKIAELAGSYDIEVDDFKTKTNWGIFDGRAVVIDVGLSKDVWQTHYVRR